MYKVVLGLSGGVDSAVAAIKLRDMGCKVFGLYCIMHDYAISGIDAAKKVADEVGIPLETVDLRGFFSDIVERNFLSEYSSGRTPNPCVICNPTVKFKALTDYADDISAEKIATGHYAGINFENGRWSVEKSLQKDQSYMLCRLSQHQLSRSIFPLHNTEKPHNRNVAEKEGVSSHNKKDSQEICFIPSGNYADFIESKIGIFPEGDFWLEDENRAVGKHKGIIKYTIGQTKKLGISLGVSLYVKSLDLVNNRVILSKNDVFYSDEIVCDNIICQNIHENFEFIEADVKLRYAHKGGKARIINKNGKLHIFFDEPQRAVTPGQFAVAYQNNKILCSGRII